MFSPRRLWNTQYLRRQCDHSTSTSWRSEHGWDWETASHAPRQQFIAMVHLDANDNFILGLPPDDMLRGHLLLLQSGMAPVPCCPVRLHDVEQFGPANRDDFTTVHHRLPAACFVS